MAVDEYGIVDDQLPVFVFPSSINFYCNEPSSYRQMLTLYNPYQFIIKFKVLCTSPRKYYVIEPEGYIRPGSCLDITIRLLDTSLTNVLKEDRFSVQMIKKDRPIVMGTREITAMLYAARNNDEKDREDEADTNVIANPSKDTCEILKSPEIRTANRPHIFFILAAIISGVVLCLPSEQGTILPSYLCISPTPKYVAAYVLGILTIIFCKSSL